MSKSADKSKESILSEYYLKYYHSTLYQNACQSLGTRYFDYQLERSWQHPTEPPRKLLEIGFASGEHVSKVRAFPSEEYVGLDINSPATQDYLDALPVEKHEKLKFVQSDAADMPFNSNHFDRVVSTCLLHHVSEPLKVLQEIRRVTSDNGQIAIGMPADPGILNRLIKTFVTYPGMRRAGVKNPKLIYALEHPNQIGGLIALANHVFQDDELRVTYAPFRIPSWNLNLMVIVHVRISKPLERSTEND